MKISATGSGGYAGLTENHVLESTELSAAEKNSLESMLSNIGFFDTTTEIPQGAINADALRWEITVVDGDQRHTVKFIQDGGPESAPWQKLLEKIKSAR